MSSPLWSTGYKDQGAGLEIAESFITRRSSSTVRKSRIHAHDDCVEVAQGWFTDKGGDVDLTRLKSGMSFLQVKASMTMKEKLRQVRNAICVNRREIELEAIAGATTRTA